MEQYAFSLITLLALWLIMHLQYIVHNGQQKTWTYVKQAEELRREISIMCD